MVPFTQGNVSAVHKVMKNRKNYTDKNCVLRMPKNCLFTALDTAILTDMV